MIELLKKCGSFGKGDRLKVFRRCSDGSVLAGINKANPVRVAAGDWKEMPSIWS